MIRGDPMDVKTVTQVKKQRIQSTFNIMYNIIIILKLRVDLATARDMSGPTRTPLG